MIAIYFRTRAVDRNIQTVSIMGKEFKIELAKSSSEHEKGLMDRTHLDGDAGMLFVFKKTEIQTFWMKNTLIPLDIIWIDDGKIVDIKTLQPAGQSPLGGAPSDNIPQYKSKAKANFVLEINAGLAEKYGFKVGDEVKFNY